MGHASEPTPELIQAFADGELPADEAVRVREAIAADPRAAAELEECIYMAVLAEQLRQAPPDRLVWPHPARRRRRVQAALVAAGAIAVAAAVWLLVGRSAPRTGSAPSVAVAFAGALAPTRSLEPRLSWLAADGYRPYDADRAAGAPAPEPVPLGVLARVEALGEPTALAAAQLLAGNAAAAERALLTAAPSADVASDRAALALLRDDPEAALIAADAALAAQPDHAQAHWNRALALARLGLARSAADELAAAAARSGDDWSDEARARADALRAELARRELAWIDANTAGDALVRGEKPDPNLLASFVGLSRLYLYDALRVAPDAARAHPLAPLAARLDAATGGRVLVERVARAADADPRVRSPLAARYRAVLDGDTDGARALADDARRAGADDIALGALLLAGPTPGRVPDDRLDAYASLAQASDDPWFALLAAEQRASAALDARDASRAETLLREAAVACDARPVPYRCPRLWRLQAHAYLTMQRAAAANRALERAWAGARAEGDVPLERQLLWDRHMAAAAADDVAGSTHGLGAAYLDEWRRGATICPRAEQARDAMAMLLVNTGRLDEARASYARTDTGCDAPFTAHRAFTLAHLLPGSGDAAAIAAAGAAIEARRAQADASERAFLDHAEGRLLLGQQPEAARALLRRAITGAAELAADDVTAAKARDYSFAVLIDDAARRGAWREALALLAQQLDVAAPTRCALGAAAEDLAAFVALDAAGAAHGVALPLAHGTSSRLPPPELTAALDGCERVDVLARGVYRGSAGLLPPTLAWRFSVPTRAPVTPGPARMVFVAGATPPAALELPALAPFQSPADSIALTGSAATPAAVLAALAHATYAEIHAHGLLAADAAEPSLLALSPDGSGRYALSADDVRGARLASRPVVVLAACHGATAGGGRQRSWSLADAFLAAGARAVIASPAPIRDRDAGAFFAALRARLTAGDDATSALARTRAEWRGDTARATAEPWMDQLVVFE